MNVLVINPGSSSLKLRLVADDDRVREAVDLSARDGRFNEAEAAAAVDGMGPADAAGFRIVHGGVSFASSVVLEEDVLEALRALIPLAPLHQEMSLAAVALVRKLRPGLPAVGCFDTAFHASISAETSTYALPKRWREDHGLRRYGFHGLSHAYASRSARELLAVSADVRLVTCHLGAGCSCAAVVNGRSVDTTMGFTPLEGLVMATRSGSVDPGIVIWLQEHAGMSLHDVATGLERRSGLLALAGSSDMRDVLASAARADGDAELAVTVYCHRLRAAIAAMAAAMDGIDVLVFTGGVGENAPEIRERTVAGLGFLGISLDLAMNRSALEDADVSGEHASVRTVVIRAREDVEIAREVRRLMKSGEPRR